jgi:folate-binding protein YgfZ
LENYVIADDVVIEDFTEERVGFSFLGYGEQSGWAGSDEVVFRGRRAVEENLEWVFPISRRSEARKRVAGLTEVGFDEMSRRRIEARIPAVPADIGPGDLPGEGGLEAAAVSYTKGCYLGQEVMARLKSMGQVRRRLMKVTGSGDPPAGGLPAEIFAGDRKAGELRSVARREAGGWVGLAMITLMHVGPGASLALTAKGGQTVELMDAP